MAEHIVFADGTSFACPEQAAAPVMGWPKEREWKTISVLATAEEVRAVFVDGAAYVREWESQTGENEGQPIYETMSEDLSAYSVAGDIVDHRDGTVTVFMGKPTELEILRELLQTANQVIGGEISVEDYQAAVLAKGEGIGEIGIIKDKGKS